VQFLRIAHGSLRELDTQVEIGWRVGYLNEIINIDLKDSITAVEKLLAGLIASIDK
jgi:four helix bundle protein